MECFTTESSDNDLFTSSDFCPYIIYRVDNIDNMSFKS